MSTHAGSWICKTPLTSNAFHSQSNRQGKVQCIAFTIQSTRKRSVLQSLPDKNQNDSEILTPYYYCIAIWFKLIKCASREVMQDLGGASECSHQVISRPSLTSGLKSWDVYCLVVYSAATGCNWQQVCMLEIMLRFTILRLWSPSSSWFCHCRWPSAFQCSAAQVWHAIICCESLSSWKILPCHLLSSVLHMPEWRFQDAHLALPWVPFLSHFFQLTPSNLHSATPLKRARACKTIQDGRIVTSD